jgi:protein-disulfide isomerase
MVTKNSAPMTDELENKACCDEWSNTISLTHILLVIVIFLNALWIYLLTGNSFSFPGMSNDSFGIKQALLDVEYDKAGSRANYELLTRAQQLSLMDPQNPSNIKAMKQYVESFGSGGTKQATSDSAEWTVSSLTGEQLTKIVNSSAIQGNKAANILVIEYSDTECPFCIKQYQETKLWPKLQAQYGDKVKFAFKNNKWVNHPGTEAKAIGALCAKKIGWDEAYIKFYTTVMDSSTQALVYDVAKLPDAAKIAGVDQKLWQKCFDAKETQSIFSEETAEALSLGLGGTPGTLILNIETGEYSTVEWAYPFETFTQKIDALLK